MKNILAILLLSACSKELPQALNDLNGDFFDAPFPNALRTLENGAPDYTGFPNPSETGLIRDYLEVTEGLNGSSTVAPITFRFDGKIDPNDLPSAKESLQATSSVLLLDIDPTSPHNGELLPIQSHWQRKATSHQASNLLSIAPIYGIPLRPGTEYAAIIGTELAEAAEGFPEALVSAETGSALGRLRDGLNALGVPADEVAIATTFRTQNPVEELAEYAWWTRNNVPLPALDQELEYVEYDKKYRHFTGTMEVPLWQSGAKPYATKGGGFIRSENGNPKIFTWEDATFSLTIPSEGDMPEDGWPVLVYSHGTGGSYNSCCYSGTSSIRPARQLAKRGIATFGISQPLHADRGTPGTDPDLHTFNYLNPESARHNFRQGALDIIYQIAVLASQKHTFTYAEESFALDPDNIVFMGHSQGGLTGALAAPFVGDITEAFVLSGAGGGMSITLTQRKDVMDIEALIKQLLRFDNDEDLTVLHPVSGLIQVLTDITDPLNYARYWVLEKANFSTAPVPMLLTEGLLDEQTPSMTSEALGAAGGLPILEPAAHVSEAHALLGIGHQALPAVNNAMAWDGDPITVGLAQYAERDHFAVFDSKTAARLVYDFLASAIEGEPTLGQ
jgi:pimeloyl-ACP methyl ester carboxylesterase